MINDSICNKVCHGSFQSITRGNKNRPVSFTTTGRYQQYYTIIKILISHSPFSTQGNGIICRGISFQVIYNNYGYLVGCTVIIGYQFSFQFYYLFWCKKIIGKVIDKFWWTWSVRNFILC